MPERKRTTYTVQIAGSDASLRPTLVTDSVEVGPDGRLHGRIEFQNTTDEDIELSTDPLFAWGDGLRISEAPVGITVGGAYSQETNPDPFAWYARHGAAGTGTKTLRVHDSRRPTAIPA